MTELAESERVCHASAMRARDPVTMPAQYFNAKRTRFTAMLEIPSA
jgi:hypothetical protein